MGRHKPPPIAPRSEGSSSPHLVDVPSPPFQSQGFHDNTRHDSSQLLSGARRSRPHTPSQPKASSHQTLSYVSPPPKKARLSPGTTSSGSSRPKTPTALGITVANDPSTSPPLALMAEKAPSKQGLPAPTTPNPNPRALPTLTELLASSRQSKARPRRASRQNKAGAALQRKTIFKEQNVPAQVPAAQPEDADPSPAKTSFSSLVSLSSPASPDPLRNHALSPVSPLFTQNPGAFAPAFASSQHRGGGADDGGGGFFSTGGYGSGHGLSLARGSSGVYNLGYNSQFDVDGRVDRVSELLDRDVDYSGWLRDIPDDDETPLPTES